MFDASPSQRAFLWLDFCHSGGIIPRDLGSGLNDQEVIERTLKVAQGQGKLIMAACTPEQKAYELGHGLFTGALLRGLKGEAANKGEVTVNSLYDYIDRQMGGDRQRPMMFGQTTGRVVLMHYADMANLSGPRSGRVGRSTFACPSPGYTLGVKMFSAANLAVASAFSVPTRLRRVAVFGNAI